jgi:Secretion system C-terminal sorting domain/PKD domain
MASLVVGNANCSDTLTKNVVISPLPNSGFTFTKSGRTVNFTPTSSGQTAYDWDFDDGSTANTESPTHEFDQAIVQTFNVCLRVTSQPGCQSQSCNDISIDLVGIEDKDLQFFAIYPNPNKGSFTISIGEINGDMQIDITDATGKLIHVVDTDNITTSYQVQLENVATGIYMVNVKNGETTTSQRIMVTR